MKQIATPGLMHDTGWDGEGVVGRGVQDDHGEFKSMYGKTNIML